MISLRCIISGGQTGADRGGLLAAHDLGLQRGGMAPLGWRAEDGQIPEWFRSGMTQSPSAGYPVRTRANVEASGGTLIVSCETPLTGGSDRTRSMCIAFSKPVIVFNPAPRWLNATQINWALEWLKHFEIRTLNVAGPRESREPGLQAATRAALNAILADELGFGGR